MKPKPVFYFGLVLAMASLLVHAEILNTPWLLAVAAVGLVIAGLAGI